MCSGQLCALNRRLDRAILGESGAAPVNWKCQPRGHGCDEGGGTGVDEAEWERAANAREGENYPDNETQPVNINGGRARSKITLRETPTG